MLSVLMRCLREELKQSSLHTTIVSPGRTNSSASPNPFRSALDLALLSIKSSSQPTCFSASIWRASCCSCLDTQIYPTFIPSPPFILALPSLFVIDYHIYHNSFCSLCRVISWMRKYHLCSAVVSWREVVIDTPTGSSTTRRGTPGLDVFKIAGRSISGFLSSFKTGNAE